MASKKGKAAASGRTPPPAKFNARARASKTAGSKQAQRLGKTSRKSLAASTADGSGGDPG